MFASKGNIKKYLNSFHNELFLHLHCRVMMIILEKLGFMEIKSIIIKLTLTNHNFNLPIDFYKIDINKIRIVFS